MTASVRPDLSLNLRIRGMKPSATVAINERADKLIADGRRIYKLGLGQSPFPVPEPVVEELRRNAERKAYLPVKGLPELRRTIAARYAGKFGIPYTEEDVLIGPGSKELMFLLQLAFYGDLVIPTPAWVSYAPQARIIGRRVQMISTERSARWNLSAAQLETLCAFDPTRPRVVILNYPANPTGYTYSADELRAIAEVARKYRVILLSDEIYGRLHHEGAHESIVPSYPEGTIYSGGLSKWCGAGGWRLGIFVFPPSLRPLADMMAAVASETYTSTSAPIQYAAIAAYRDSPEIEDYVRRCRRVLKSLGRRLAARLRRAGADLADPEGGFYLFPDFTPLKEALAAKGVQTSVELCERLLQDTGVAVLPGADFGRPPEEMTVRLSYVNFDGRAALEAAAADLSDAQLEEVCAPTLEAVELLASWIEAR